MGYGFSQASSTRYESLGLTGALGVTTTASATVNTKGAYATIGTTTFDYDGFWLNVAVPASESPAPRFRIDIAINNGGADEIIVADFYQDWLNSSASWYTSSNPCFFVPVRVPKGAIVKARCQATVASATINVWVQGQCGDARSLRGFRAMLAATDWGAGTDPSNAGLALSGTTQTAWIAVQASTPARFAALYIMTTGEGNNLAAALLRIDIGWGPTASAHLLCSAGANMYYPGDQVSGNIPIGPFPCDIPAGTQLDVRYQSGYASAAGTLFPILYGLVP